MAVGVPVIVPPNYQTLFKEIGVIYAKPHEVEEKINQLISDDIYYRQVVERAYDYERNTSVIQNMHLDWAFLNGK